MLPLLLFHDLLQLHDLLLSLQSVLVEVPPILNDENDPKSYSQVKPLVIPLLLVLILIRVSSIWLLLIKLRHLNNKDTISNHK